MAKRTSNELTNAQIIARLNKPKSMRHIRAVMNPLFEEAKKKFGDAIVEIVEREHWGPNFDAYYDVRVCRRWPDIQDFFSQKLHELLLERYVFVLTQIIKTDDYHDALRKPARKATGVEKTRAPLQRKELAAA